QRTLHGRTAISEGGTRVLFRSQVTLSGAPKCLGTEGPTNSRSGLRLIPPSALQLDSSARQFRSPARRLIPVVFVQEPSYAQAPTACANPRCPSGRRQPVGPCRPTP